MVHGNANAYGLSWVCNHFPFHLRIATGAGAEEAFTLVTFHFADDIPSFLCIKRACITYCDMNNEKFRKQRLDLR
jgi:hypothetical protein